jgi:hypothetical protein
MNYTASMIVAASICVAPMAVADKLPLPKAAYSADVTFEEKGREFSGHVNVDGPKERREVRTVAGNQRVAIIRRDQGKVYDLRPQKHLAVALRLAAAEAAGEIGSPGTDIDAFYGADAQPEGTETINGFKTTKYDVKIVPGPDLTVAAVVWATDDGIIVKIMGKTSVGSDNSPAEMELKNVKIGPQDAALFEVPPGMTILSANNDLPDTVPAPASGPAPAPVPATTAEPAPATEPAPAPAASEESSK